LKDFSQASLSVGDFLKTEVGKKMADDKTKTDPTKASTNNAPTGFQTQLRDDAVEVAYRAAALQTTKRLKVAIVEALSERLPPDRREGGILDLQALFQTDLGDVLIGGLASAVVPYGAALIGQKGPKVERLSHELRLHAGTVAASGLFDKLLEILSPVMDSLKSLPEIKSLPEVPAKDGLFSSSEAKKTAVTA
jgi:hypothetical protein